MKITRELLEKHYACKSAIDFLENHNLLGLDSDNITVIVDYRNYYQ